MLLDQTYLNPDQPWPTNPKPPCTLPGAPEFRTPFLAWNRIQGVLRSDNIEDALQARVYDPLWFLSRQWQFGEFKAENAGSIIKAKVKFNATKPSGLLKGNETDIDLIGPNETLHLASEVQSLKPELTIKQRIFLGNFFLKLIREQGWNDNSQIQAFCSSNAFGFEIAQLPPITEWHNNLDVIKILADRKAHESCMKMQGKIPDGLRIYQAMQINSSQLNDYFLNITNWIQVREKFINVIEKLYPHVKDSEIEANWDSGNMSSSFKVVYPKKVQGQFVECQLLGSEDLKNANIDWYQLDVLSSYKQVINLSSYRQQGQISVIPTASKFKGMPSSRWWELEDASVELWKAGVELDETLKLIVAEYATVYSNNWLVIPFRRKEMELVDIEWVKVSDVFGSETTLQNALTSSNSDLEPMEFGWNMFHHSLTDSNENILSDNFGSSLHSSILLGSSRAVAYSDEIERVEFVRDEMDNKVWGVELKIRDKYGNTRSGQELSDELTSFLRSDSALEEIEFTGLHFKLTGSVSEHYIPFIPMRTGLGDGAFNNRQIALQRAWLPRYLNGNIETRIRPRTLLLRKDIAPNDSIIPGAPRFAIKEETIPRTGLTVSDRYYYARGVDGAIHLWLGRSSSLGSSASAGNLTFDQVIFKKSNTTSDAVAPDVVNPIPR